MRVLTSLIAILLSAASLAFGQSETKRYLYLSTPDGAQKQASMASAEASGLFQ